MQFVFDLDGTICFRGKPLTDPIVQCLEDLGQKGHEVIFASARPIRDMLPVLPESLHGGSLIGGNGSMISKNGRVVQTEAFTAEQTSALLALIAEHDAAYLIDSDWDYAYTGPDDHPIRNNLDPSRLARCIALEELKTIVKILILSARDMEGLAEKLSRLGVVVHRHRHEDVIDLSPPNIHKWNAIQRLGVKEGSFIAFGNDANDIPMFRAAGHAVMIGHHPDLAAYATEDIPLQGDDEARIIAKIQELAARHPLLASS
ncbi:HAD-IIB family hydrolase [Paenibacillus thiaminolyticus]|uniref:HAD-IIB family hydrolase n=1 Tax=Paenibacillus thiaminolyticus TaxID=49283 RepID=A0A3A3H704_PANTH|nr:HAD-IIB family hydrolase [Paenibacillus thiaminolyticus]RJG25621.1 HAD-IIB family hydrolase [Paenibacillus thiaminolyticus]